MPKYESDDDNDEEEIVFERFRKKIKSDKSKTHKLEKYSKNLEEQNTFYDEWDE